MIKTLRKTLKELGNDVRVHDWDTEFFVDLVDFAGFDDDWNEIMRPYDNPELVIQFKRLLNRACKKKTSDGMYTTYVFDDCVVCLGYTSFDI